jgi:hypothetical protein
MDLGSNYAHKYSSKLYGYYEPYNHPSNGQLENVHDVQNILVFYYILQFLVLDEI